MVPPERLRPVRAYQVGGMRKWALGVQTKPLCGGTISPCLRLRRGQVPVSLVDKRGSRGADSEPERQAALDADSRQWVEKLRVGHPQYEQTVSKLHGVLRRVALYELSRR